MADDETIAERERKRDRIRRYASRAVRVPLRVRTSDLPVRLGSALVMLGLFAFALYQGEMAWTIFVSAIALAVLWEWFVLVRRFRLGGAGIFVWLLSGLAYIGLAGFTLVALYWQFGVAAILLLAGTVIWTDVGAYFSGRALGGPKIAPRISPSKTWAGLMGGMAMAAAWLALGVWFVGSAASALAGSEAPVLERGQVALAALAGAALAATAQIGDFFESWMKRRAGVKDSGDLIPGHGGLFDRMDGMMAVAAVIGLPFIVWSL